jgi:hypothetical protein
MKKIIKYSCIIALVISCQAPDNPINDILDTVGKGAVLRTISTDGEYNFYAPDTSIFSATIEEHDAENGALMQNVEVFVSLNGTNETLYKPCSPVSSQRDQQGFLERI